jgi:hypothetical protein
LGPPERGRAVAVLRGFENSRVAAYYLPGGAERVTSPTLPVTELVVVGDPRSAANALSVPPVPGLELAEEVREGDLALARLRSPAPVELPVAGLYGGADVLVQGGPP